VAPQFRRLSATSASVAGGADGVALVKDNLAARLTATILAAMLIGAVLDVGLSHLIGRWSRPSLIQSGLLQTAVEVARILETAPPQDRATLAAAASSRSFRVDWHARWPLAPGVAAKLHHLNGDDLAVDPSPDLSVRDRNALVVTPRDPAAFDAGLTVGRRQFPQAYILLLSLRDGGWVSLCVYHRNWGVGATVRMIVGAALLTLSAIVLAVLSARWLARPLEALNQDIQRLGVDRQASPIVERGPLELRRTIAAVNTMQARIQAFIEARTLMLATISHDLRTPLTRLRLRSELLRDTALGRDMTGDVDEMSAMVNAALALFRDEFAEGEASTVVDLAALLQVVIDDYSDRNIQIPLNLRGTAVILGRPYALKRALNNIIDNAVRYAREVEVELGAQDKTVSVDILDRGPGLPETALDQVFRPFLRLTADGSHHRDGLGLGLTSARAIAAAHNGCVQAHNRPGGGLRVSIRLPVASA
jgi:signal transduction histidine kinase